MIILASQTERQLIHHSLADQSGTCVEEDLRGGGRCERVRFGRQKWILAEKGGGVGRVGI